MKVAEGRLEPHMVKRILKIPKGIREALIDRIKVGELEGRPLGITLDVISKKKVPKGWKMVIATGGVSPTYLEEALEVLPIDVEVPPEKIKIVVEAWEKMMKELEEFKKRPDYPELQRLKESFLWHWRAQRGLDVLTCPICGADWTHLKWECCGLNIVEAWEKAQKLYEETSKGKRKVRKVRKGVVLEV